MLPSRLADRLPARSLVMGSVLSMSVALLGGCSLFQTDTPPDPATIPVDQLYSTGIDQLNADNLDKAVKTFASLEQTYPYSGYVVNAELMQGYGEYLRQHYSDAIVIIDRFIQLHPANRDIAYAYYLRALCYYEQIADIQRDQKGTADAMTALQEVVSRFPDSPYARDARLKIDLARDHLAGKEMEVGRYYEKQKLYTAAIGRFQRVVDQYQTTNHVPEALSRLTEIYLILGLTDEARRTAAVLGHNYPGNEWYADSYRQLVEAGQVTAAAGDTPPQATSGGFFSHLIPSIF